MTMFFKQQSNNANSIQYPQFLEIQEKRCLTEISGNFAKFRETKTCQTLVMSCGVSF